MEADIDRLREREIRGERLTARNLDITLRALGVASRCSSFVHQAYHAGVATTPKLESLGRNIGDAISVSGT
jgi:hypothetical protein